MGQKTLLKGNVFNIKKINLIYEEKNKPFETINKEGN
jgi:hypothetical protein